MNRKRSNPTLLIMMITLASLLCAIVGVILLSAYQSDIEGTYSEIVSHDFANRQYIHEISNDLSTHEILMFRHILSKNLSEEDINSIHEQSKSLEASMKFSLEQLREGSVGTEYESYYSGVKETVSKYFEDIQKGNELFDAGENEAAAMFYDMEVRLDLEKADAEMRKYDSMVEEFLGKATDRMNGKIMVAKTSAIIIIAVITIFAGITLLSCFRISDLIVRKDSLTKLDRFDTLRRDSEKLKNKGKLSEYTAVTCNIKDFRFLNQQMGDKIGDHILIGYARKLEQFIKKDEHIARNGGDNYIMLIKQGREKELIDYLAKIEIEVYPGGTEVKVPIYTRCGIYKIADDDVFGDVVNACHLALDEARETTQSDIVWYNRSMSIEMEEYQELLMACEEGLEKHEFIAYYQPKVDVRSKQLCGAEALARWMHDGKFITPAKFVPVLEQEGIISRLDFYIFEQVCQDINAWIAKGIQPVRISSNFSKLNLKDPEFANKLLAIVDKYNVESKFLEIELTESTGYENFEAAKAFITRMNERGIATSIDDFGTGYSSLSLLKDLDVRVIKLDKSFIDEVENDDEKQKRIIENVVNMINDLHRDVICEGVETNKQANFLRSINCNMVQGFLFDKSLHPEAFEQRLINPYYLQ